MVPVAFEMAASKPSGNPERGVRLGCRDIFRQSKLLDRIIPDIENILAAGAISRPEVFPTCVGMNRSPAERLAPTDGSTLRLRPCSSNNS